MDDRYTEEISLRGQRRYNNMIEIYQDGKLKWTITDVGSTSDIVVIPKEIARDCSMSADRFQELFYACLSGSNSAVDAYNKAEEIHIKYFERPKYSGYDSFGVVKSRKNK